MVTDKQVRRLMEELNKYDQLGIAARRAGMDRKTARKYRDIGKLPSELKKPRQWRTRQDNFDAEDWAPQLSELSDDGEFGGGHRRLLETATRSPDCSRNGRGYTASTYDGNYDRGATVSGYVVPLAGWVR